tara:strand:- start:906 stop:1154 length:249 start_codon:yes stop_codon:yes gene_type:complete
MSVKFPAPTEVEIDLLENLMSDAFWAEIERCCGTTNVKELNEQVDQYILNLKKKWMSSRESFWTDFDTYFNPLPIDPPDCRF